MKLIYDLDYRISNRSEIHDYTYPQKIGSTMTSPPPGDGSDIQAIWRKVLNLSPGDVIVANGQVLYYVEKMKSVGQLNGKEYTGLDGDGQRRTLNADPVRNGIPVLTVPGQNSLSQMEITRIDPYQGTILSEISAEHYLPSDQFSEEMRGGAPGKDLLRDVEFKDSERIGSCECGGEVYKFYGKAVCESCGYWTSLAIWYAWQDTAWRGFKSGASEPVEKDDVDENENGGEGPNHSLSDF